MQRFNKFRFVICIYIYIYERQVYLNAWHNLVYVFYVRIFSDLHGVDPKFMEV